METQELEALPVRTSLLAKREPENHEVHAHDIEVGKAAAPDAAAPETEAQGPEAAETAAAGAQEDSMREAERQETEGHGAETKTAGAEAAEARFLAEQVSGGSVEQDVTQLAAIRGLMAHASARGIWLTLGEIAEATEFAEASISAQLRHLRKAHHGGHVVEKRRRRTGRSSAAMRKVRDARRGSVIWEYRVLPRL